MCLYFSTGRRFSNLDPGQADSPCCRPPTSGSPIASLTKEEGHSSAPAAAAAHRELQAGPAWLPGPRAQRSQPVAPPASVCARLAAAEPEASLRPVQQGSGGCGAWQVRQDKHRDPSETDRAAAARTPTRK